MKGILGLFALAVTSTLVLAACGDDGNGGADTCGAVNSTQTCDCPGDPAGGAQTCQADGTWSVCECASGDTDLDATDTGTDATDTDLDATDTATDATDATDTTDTAFDTTDTAFDTTDTGCPDDDDDGVCNAFDLCPGGDDGVDSDGDDVPDDCDACEGFDDGADGDLDTVPDGCDVCPVGADHIDTDEDGVPDGCDECEGFDDSLDEDGDGIPDDCDCNQTVFGFEVCDGRDNNCNSLVDELCGAFELEDLESFACFTQVNGNFLAPDGTGGAFIGEFPGSNSAQGSLHHVADDGTVTDDVNTAMPFGFRDIEMSFDGRLWAIGSGGATFPNWDHIVMEIDPADGSTIATVYQQPMDRDLGWFYAAGITVSSAGDIYFGNESSSDPFVVHVVDDAIEEWGTGFGNNTDLALDADEAAIWVASGNRVGRVTEGSVEPEFLVDLGGQAITGMTVDADGLVWFAATTGSFPSVEGATLYRFAPDEERLTAMGEVTASGVGMSGPAYDPVRDELVFWIRHIDADTPACAGVLGALYRLSLSDL